MKRGLKVARIVLTAAVVVGAVVWLWPRGEREPEYQGKKLSEWMEGISQMPPDALGIKEREEAVRRIGTNALPFLVRWIRCASSPEPSKLDMGVLRVLGPRLAPKWVGIRFKKMYRACDAARAFRAIGAAADPAIPELAILGRGTNKKVSGLARMALTNIRSYPARVAVWELEVEAGKVSPLTLPSPP